MSWASSRRSLKNRCAARVDCESGVPKIWTIGAGMGGSVLRRTIAAERESVRHKEIAAE